MLHFILTETCKIDQINYALGVPISIHFEGCTGDHLYSSQ